MTKFNDNIFPDIPAAVSLPHFLDADPSLLEDVDGLQPIRKKHESFAILQQVNYIHEINLKLRYLKKQIDSKKYKIDR